MTLVMRSWQHDNSRWDLLDVMRACYALRPEEDRTAGRMTKGCRASGENI